MAEPMDLSDAGLERIAADVYKHIKHAFLVGEASYASDLTDELCAVRDAAIMQERERCAGIVSYDLAPEAIVRRIRSGEGGVK